MKTIDRIFVIAILFLSVQMATAQAPTVMFVSPQKQIINAPRTSPIIVNFNVPLNEQSVNNNSFRVFGRQLGPIPGTFEILSGDKQVKFTPAQPFHAGEWITVSLSKEIMSQNNIPMEKGYNWNFWTKAESGTLNQTLIRTIPVRRQGEGLIQCYGALGMDFNDDGKTDLAIVNEISRDFRVYLNTGVNYDTMFSLYPTTSGNFPSPSDAADFNRDGKVDIVIGNAGNSVMNFFVSNGGGTFQPGLVYTAGNNVRGVGVADLDGDGWDDVITANRGGSNISLFRNNGNGTFATAVNINTVGNSETAVMMTDANNDGVMDAFVGCYQSGEIVLMLGDGNGGMTYSSRSPLAGPPWAIAVGDMNGDGNADVAACLSSANKIGVIFGNGSGGLSTVTNYNSGQFPLAIDIGDVDGDNDLDLIASDYQSGDYKVYGNNGSGIFTNNPITLPASSAGSCITVHDRDNDGDLDLAGIDEVDDLLFVFNNGTVGINPISTQIPSSFSLNQNYPNPFNPSTKIRFDLSSDVKRLPAEASAQAGQTSNVKLTVYDIKGKEVEVLVNEKLSPGSYEVVWNAANYASGIYLYKISSEYFSETKRMILMK